MMILQYFCQFLDTLIIFQLDGEGWRSSQPKYAPKNAASMMTPGGLLTPEPASSATAEEEKVGNT